MEATDPQTSGNTPKEYEVGDKCPQKKTWPVIEMTAEEKAAMTKPEVRIAGPYRYTELNQLQ